MALKVWGTDPENQPTPRTSFADDLVGRFHAGYMVNNRPATVEEWRMTTGDPDVADKLHELFGGDEPQKIATEGEFDHELFTAAREVNIIIERTSALRQRMVMWGRNNKLIYATDGEWKLDDSGNPTDEADPDASLTFAERKLKANEGTGPVPETTLYFRLADEPDLGIFRFRSGGWTIVSDMAYEGTEDKLADAIADSEEGKAIATLALEPVSYVAKRGPRAGQTVSFTKSAIKDIRPL